jgi:hypothetical protein
MSPRIGAIATSHSGGRILLATALALFSASGCYRTLDVSKVVCQVGDPKSCPDGFECRMGHCCSPGDRTCGAFDASGEASPQPSLDAIGQLGEVGFPNDGPRVDSSGWIADTSQGGADGAGKQDVDASARPLDTGATEAMSPPTDVSLVGSDGLDNAALDTDTDTRDAPMGAGGSSGVDGGGGAGGVAGSGGGAGSGDVDAAGGTAGRGAGGTATGGTSAGGGGSGSGGIVEGTGGGSGGTGSGGAGTGGASIGSGGSGTGGTTNGTGGSGTGGSGTGGSGTDGSGAGGSGTGGSGTGGTTDTGGSPGTGGAAPGRVWTLLMAPVRAWNAVTYGNPGFVAVGDANNASDQQTVMTSTNGLTWTGHTTGLPGYSWNTVGYGNGLFVAVGTNTSGAGAIMTSPDGTTWTQRTPGTYIHGGGPKIAFGNGMFVVVGNWTCTSYPYTYICGVTSPDGITWTDRFYGGYVAAEPAGPTDIAFGNGTFHILRTSTSSSPDSVSANGTDWSVFGGTGSDAFSFGTRTNHGIVYGNGMFLTVVWAPSVGVEIDRLQDGDTAWTHVKTIDQFSTLTGFGNNTFVIITPDSDQIAISFNSITWISVTAPVSDSWTSVAYGANRFVAIAHSGEVMYSGGTP